MVGGLTGPHDESPFYLPSPNSITSITGKSLRYIQEPPAPPSSLFGVPDSTYRLLFPLRLSPPLLKTSSLPSSVHCPDPPVSPDVISLLWPSGANHPRAP